MAKVGITIATWDYDRVRPLMDGRVRVEGCEVNYVVVNLEECFHRAWYHQEFDVTEVGLAGYYAAVSRGKGNFGLSPYVAIPVHLSRSFRASAIYVRSDRGIDKPADLRGRKVGVPEYQITAAVWARGFLSDEFGVRTAEMNWYQGGMDDPGRKDKWPNNLPEGFPLQTIGPGDTLNRMLEQGALDALVCPRRPRAYQARDGSVRRLFEDFEPVERAYYEKTKIFPIMHVLGIRRELHEKHPWLARNLYQAFCEAKGITQAELFETAALRVGLPWLVASAERSRAALGEDIFPYGYENSLPTLAAMSRYMVEQSIAVRPVDPEELFPATTMSDPKT